MGLAYVHLHDHVDHLANLSALWKDQGPQERKTADISAISGMQLLVHIAARARSLEDDVRVTDSWCVTRPHADPVCAAPHPWIGNPGLPCGSIRSPQKDSHGVEGDELPLSKLGHKIVHSLDKGQSTVKSAVVNDAHWLKMTAPLSRSSIDIDTFAFSVDAFITAIRSVDGYRTLVMWPADDVAA